MLTATNCPVISVLIPTTAANLDYFEQAIRSVLEQTFSDFEIILVFDGCTKEHAAKALAPFDDPRIRPFVSERKRGISRCLNIGARLARAPLIARMDDDDRCLPTRFERQVEVMRSGGVDVLGTWVYLIDEHGARRSDVPSKSDSTPPLTPFRAIFGSIFAHPSVMMRREWLLRFRYDPRWDGSEDRELWIRGAPASRYACIAEPLLEYRKPRVIKRSRMRGVTDGYSLIWRHREQFGIWTPMLIGLNTIRQGVYWVRIGLGR